MACGENGVEMFLSQRHETVGHTRRSFVLMYHSLHSADKSAPANDSVAGPLFAQHMQALSERGYSPCSIDEYVSWLSGEGMIKEGNFLITFDDGYQSVYKYAFPILKAMGWSATVFLVTGMMEKTPSWLKQSARHLERLLSTNEIREMAKAGFCFHSHTHMHVDLTNVSDKTLQDELAASKQVLATITDNIANESFFIAYPYGRCDRRVVDAVKRTDYKAAFSVMPGFNRTGGDLFNVHRLDIRQGDSVRKLIRKVTFGMNDGSARNVLRYYARRFQARFPHRAAK